MDADVFRELLADVFHTIYPAWNDEDLMHEPSEALSYCNVIRDRVGSPTLPDSVILRALSGLRKQSAA